MAKRCLLLTGLLLVVLLVLANCGTGTRLRRLESILSLLEEHERYRWRQRPFLDTRFEGHGVRTDAEGFRLEEAEGRDEAGPGKEAPLVLCYGASPTFGYGVAPSASYPFQLARFARERALELRVENRGCIGHSSWQGLRVLRDGLRGSLPRIVTVSHVVNDVDRLRFFRSDGERDSVAPMPSPWRVRLSNGLRRFPPSALFGKQLRRLVAWSMGEMPEPRIRRLMRRRVDADEYVENLRRMAAAVRGAGATCIFLILPFRLPEPVTPRPKGVDEKLGQVDEALRSGELHRATVLVDELVGLDGEGGDVWAAKARFHEAAGQKDEARRAWQRTRKGNVVDCIRDAARYNELMLRVAREENVAVVDARPALGRERADMRLFVKDDYIHPNREGHSRIARGLLRAIEAVLEGREGFFVEKCQEG